MSKLFEAFFQDVDKPWEFYERYSLNGKSFINRIKDEPTTFIEDSNGEFNFILDKSVKLKRVLKKSTKELNVPVYGTNNVGLEHIRKFYWDFSSPKYNMNPKVWSIDIETTAHAPVDVKNCRERIVSIQVFDHDLETNIILAIENFDIQKHTKNNNYFFDDREYDFKVKYVKLNTEAELLNAFFKLIENLKPLLILAHNGSGFDFSYLWKRTEKLGLQERFSPFGKSKLSITTLENGMEFYKIDAPGVFYMDSLDLYKKYVLAPRVSYSLDSLCELELGERKVNHDCFSTFDGFRTGEGYVKPETEPCKESILEYKLFHAKDNDEIIKISKEYFIHYSIIDTYLLSKLIRKLKLVDIMLSVASTMGCQISQVLGTIQPWTCYIRNYALMKNLVLPDEPVRSDDTEFKGGFVKEPITGKYDWVFSVDVTSMYPSQIMAFNMSADSFIPFHKLPLELQECANEMNLSEDEGYHLSEYAKNPEKYEKFSNLLKKYNVCSTLTGAFFDKSFKGIIPKLIEIIFKRRKSEKNEMLKFERYDEFAKSLKGSSSQIKFNLNEFLNLNENEAKEKLNNFNKEELKIAINEFQNYAEQKHISQLTMKILINALYGCVGNPHFVLFNKLIASSITGNSRFYIILMGKNINHYLEENYGKSSKGEYVITQDTDSGYFAIPENILKKLPEDKNKATDYISDFIDKEIQPVINYTSKNLGNIFNALDSSRISAKREAISDKSVFVAKKRYFMRVIDSEYVRFEKPKIKKMGIDIVRSSTPIFAKKYLNDAIEIILDKDENELKKWLSEVRNEFTKQDLMNISKTSSVSSAKYNLKTDKSIPINSRAFLVTNQFINESKSNEFQPLDLGEKVKMLYLKTPNPLNSNIFAFNNENFASKFRDYVDFDTNFEKFFLKPLDIMVESLKYNMHNHSESLDEW